MRHAKILMAVATAAVAMLALAGSAWAGTTLTSPAGAKVGVGTSLEAFSEGIVALQGSLTVACGKSSLKAEVTNAGGPNAKVQATVSTFTLEECGTNTVTVLKPGNLEFQATGNGDGTLTSTGAEITILTHGTVGTIHCIYLTNETSIGTLTGSKSTGGTSTLDILGAALPQASTDAGCGAHAELVGSYSFSKPDYLYLDGPDGSTLTSPAGTIVEAGTKVKAESESSIVFDGGPFNPLVTCKKSTLEGEITYVGGAETVGGVFTGLAFNECGTGTISVLAKGGFELYTDTTTADGNGLITGSGTEITLVSHTVMGTVHCIFVTNNSNLGTVTGSKNREGKTATWSLAGSLLTVQTTDFGCSTEPKLTGSYTFTTPDYLDVD